MSRVPSGLQSGFTNSDTSVMTNASAGGSDREAAEGAGQVLRHSSAFGEVSVGSMDGGTGDTANNRQFHTGSVMGTRGMFFEMNSTTGIWTIVALMILFLVLKNK